MIFCQTRDGALSEVGLELLSKGRRLAAETGGELEALITRIGERVVPVAGLEPRKVLRVAVLVPIASGHGPLDAPADIKQTLGVGGLVHGIRSLHPGQERCEFPVFPLAYAHDGIRLAFRQNVIVRGSARRQRLLQLPGLGGVGAEAVLYGDEPVLPVAVVGIVSTCHG